MTPHQLVVETTIERLAESCEQQLQVVFSSATPELLAAWQHQLKARGKRLRLRLSLRSAIALGISEDKCHYLACACELVHQASLIHDDLMDADKSRNGLTTVWHQFSKETAICLGDALLVEAFFLINSIPYISSDSMHALSTIFRDSVHAAAEGQARDCNPVAIDSYSYADYVDAVKGKSGALLGLPVISAMAVQEYSKTQIIPVSLAFSELGVVYQLLDDVEDRHSDKQSRLNGYWVLSRQFPGQDPYRYAMTNINEHLKHAEGLLRDQPLCISTCFDYIKSLILKKHPELAVAS